MSKLSTLRETVPEYFEKFSQSSLSKSLVQVLLYGVILTSLRMVITKIVSSIYRRTFSSLMVEKSDDIYDVLFQWLDMQHISDGGRHVTLNTIISKDTDGERMDKLLYIPKYGSHTLKFEGHTIYLKRERYTNTSDYNNENITLSAWGEKSEVLRRLVDTAREVAESNEEGRLVVYTCEAGDWKKFSVRPGRALSSVIIDSGIKKKVVGTLDNFIRNRTWYRNVGIPYRFGMLLYGPPGCGKTSLVVALATHYSKPVCMLSLSKEELTDDNFNKLLNKAPKGAIVLIEDIDAAMITRETDNFNAIINSSGLTFSGLLNALDGVASQEGRIVIMTTNKELTLDKALLRPGRIDTFAKIDYPHQQQLIDYFTAFYAENIAIETTENLQTLAEQFAQSITSNDLSVSEIQKYLINFITSPEKAAANSGRIYEYLEIPGYMPEQPIQTNMTMSK